MEASLDKLQGVIGQRSDRDTGTLAAHVRHAQWVLLVSCLLSVSAGALLAWRLASSLSRSIGDEGS